MTHPAHNASALGRVSAKFMAAATAAVALLLASAPADAHDDRRHDRGRYDQHSRVNIRYVQPNYYRPAPVYYRPAPVYYRPAPAYYYTPTPAYYAPTPYYNGYSGGYTSISFGWR